MEDPYDELIDLPSSDPYNELLDKPTSEYPLKNTGEAYDDLRKDYTSDKSAYDELDKGNLKTESPSDEKLAYAMENVRLNARPDCSTFDSQFGDYNVGALAQILEQGIQLNTIRHRGCSRDFALFALQTIGAGNSKTPIASGCLNSASCTNRIAVKMTAVEDPNDPDDSGLREGFWLRSMNETLVVPMISPHIMPYLSSFVCTGDIMREAKLCFINQTDKTAFMNNLNGLKSNTINVIISAFAAPGRLLKYLEPLMIIPSNEKLWVKVLRVCIFQVLWTLVCAQRYYPHFRHNDLHPGNVLVMNNSDINSLYILEQGKSFYVDRNMLGSHYKFTSVKFWDFEYACAKDINNTGLRNGLGMVNNGNQYYDFHFFMNYLTREVGRRKVGYAQVFFDFVDRVLPDELRGPTREINGITVVSGYRLTEQGQTMARTLGLKTPVEILEDPFFDSFRVTSETVVDQRKLFVYDMTHDE